MIIGNSPYILAALLRGHDPVPDGVARELGGRVEVELFHDGVAVRCGGLGGDLERLGVQ